MDQVENMDTEELLNDIFAAEANKRNQRQREKKLIRPSKDAKMILEKEFEKNSNFSQATILKLAKKLGLSYRKVYKWSWDKRKQVMKSKQF